MSILHFDLKLIFLLLFYSTKILAMKNADPKGKAAADKEGEECTNWLGNIRTKDLLEEFKKINGEIEIVLNRKDQPQILEAIGQEDVKLFSQMEKQIKKIIAKNIPTVEKENAQLVIDELIQLYLGPMEKKVENLKVHVQHFQEAPSDHSQYKEELEILLNLRKEIYEFLKKLEFNFGLYEKFHSLAAQLESNKMALEEVFAGENNILHHQLLVLNTMSNEIFRRIVPIQQNPLVLNMSIFHAYSHQKHLLEIAQKAGDDNFETLIFIWILIEKDIRPTFQKIYGNALLDYMKEKEGIPEEWWRNQQEILNEPVIMVPKMERLKIWNHNKQKTKITEEKRNLAEQKRAKLAASIAMATILVLVEYIRMDHTYGLNTVFAFYEKRNGRNAVFDLPYEKASKRVLELKKTFKL